MARGLVFLLLGLVAAGAGTGAVGEEPKPGEPPALLTVAAGTELRGEPGHDGELLAILPAALVPVLQSRRGWVRVRHGGAEGWVNPQAPRRPGPDGRPLPASVADSEMLVEARRLLGSRERAGTLGPFLLYTDLEDSGLLRHFEGVAAGAESLYAERLRLPVPPGPGETLVLFARAEDYQEFKGLGGQVAELDLAGHAVGGLAAMPAAGGSRRSLEKTLLHELTHLINHRALGEELPPWLDEGLAEEMTLCRVDGRGRVAAPRIDRLSVRFGHRIELHGPLAVLGELIAALETGALAPLPRLLALDREAFQEFERPHLLYGAYGLWIHFLMSDGETAEAFRGFLAEVAAGAPADSEALAARLERSWDDLDRDYRRFVEALPRRLGLPRLGAQRTPR